MNSALLLMAATGRQFNTQFLTQWIEKTRERRKWIFGRLADILFGLVALFWGQLDLKVKNGAGALVDAADPGVAAEDKLNAIINGLKTSQKAELLREFFRPLVVAAAELLAELMSPDPMLLTLFSQNAPSGGTTIVNVPPAPPPPPPPTNNPAARVVRLPMSVASRVQRAQGIEILGADGVLYQIG
jgi:Mn2+/Fe2+ NRAMP family transporter